jgi:hypothetical protein
VQAKALPSSNAGHYPSYINGYGGNAPQSRVSNDDGEIDLAHFVKQHEE